MAKPPKLNGTTSRALFCLQFEVIAEHHYCKCLKNSTYFFTAMQGWATDMLNESPESRNLRGNP
jgi:hypothetical protein